MPRFKVKCFEAGVWDGAEPREIEARDEQDAAERVSGGPLKEGGQHGNLRAEAWSTSKPRAKRMFFAPPQPIKY